MKAYGVSLVWIRVILITVHLVWTQSDWSMEIGINKRFLPCSILSVNRDLDSGELSYVT